MDIAGKMRLRILNDPYQIHDPYQHGLLAERADRPRKYRCNKGFMGIRAAHSIRISLRPLKRRQR